MLGFSVQPAFLEGVAVTVVIGLFLVGVWLILRERGRDRRKEREEALWNAFREAERLSEKARDYDHCFSGSSLLPRLRENLRDISQYGETLKSTSYKEWAGLLDHLVEVMENTHPQLLQIINQSQAIDGALDRFLRLGRNWRKEGEIDPTVVISSN
jgi:hypothetical protein